MRKCKKCGADKELSEYTKHTAYADGRTRVCKECTNKKYKETKAAKDLAKPVPWFIFD